MNIKFDTVKIATIGGMVLSIAGTIIANWANTQSMNKTIEEEVEKAVDNLK